jgi:hypothetical protein
MASKKAKPGQIISGLQPATKTHPNIKLQRKPAKHSRNSLVVFLAACVLLACGIGLSICPGVLPRERPAIIEEEPDEAQPALTPGGAAALPQLAAGGGSSGKRSFVPHFGRIRPDSYVETLTINGKAPEFLSIGDLKVPCDGRPLEVYVLLHSQLDDRTEQAWRRSGMFRGEGRTLSPWLRLVTISDQDALDHLIDWHVDRVALAVPEKN